MKRRTFLASCSIGLTAGCVGLAGRPFEDDGTRIQSLRAVSYRETAEDFHAILSDNGEKTYEQTIAVPGLSEGIPGTAGFSDVLKGPQTGQLKAYVDDQPKSAWKRLSFEEIDAECVRVKLVISHVDDTFGIWYTVDCAE